MPNSEQQSGAAQAVGVAEANLAQQVYFARCDDLRRKLYELASEFETHAVPTYSQARSIAEMLQKLSFFLPSQYGLAPGRVNINITITPEGR